MCKVSNTYYTQKYMEGRELKSILSFFIYAWYNAINPTQDFRITLTQRVMLTNKILLFVVSALY